MTLEEFGRAVMLAPRNGYHYECVLWLKEWEEARETQCVEAAEKV